MISRHELGLFSFEVTMAFDLARSETIVVDSVALLRSVIGEVMTLTLRTDTPSLFIDLEAVSLIVMVQYPSLPFTRPQRRKYISLIYTDWELTHFLLSILMVNPLNPY
jgi:hypothetical protein